MKKMSVRERVILVSAFLMLGIVFFYFFVLFSTVYLEISRDFHLGYRLFPERAFVFTVITAICCLSSNATAFYVVDSSRVSPENAKNQD